MAAAAVTKKPADHRNGYLTAPSAAPAREIAQQFIADSAAEFGLSSADLSDLVVRDEYVSKHNGVTHLYVRQRLDGIEVVNGDFNLNMENVNAWRHTLRPYVTYSFIPDEDQTNLPQFDNEDMVLENNLLTYGIHNFFSL